MTAAIFDVASRAFATPQLAPGERVYVQAQQPPIVKIQCGRNGASIKTFNSNISIEVTTYLTKRPTEVVSDE
jgi:hypothetical protein